ncbi:site-specific integrase [Nostoc sp. FACHB-888]|uniref:site-specific integrase n=1 Tax=Nostoc sp. FACHB-888 TaxID=2692842 RepID=UPI0016879565|nr:site-specific integrase [Nostoc sp. FACHB-888]MBD2245118.1 site-specific integrase [Nostoc sp. FACHB-888]
MEKAKTGTVGIEKYRGKYRLRLPRAIANGSSRYIFTGLSVDSQDGYKKAQRLAWDIEDEIVKGAFNPSKYKATRKHQITSSLTLSELWQLYSNYRKPSLDISTYHAHYEGTYKRLIAEMPYHSPDDAENVKVWLVRNRPANVARRILILLSAAMDWAELQGFVATNKFKGLYKNIKVFKKKLINPFTTFEMQAILEAFQGSHYESFVRFLFLTGCRTGEAIALQWKQVAPDYSYVTINATYYPELKTRKPTKTHANRKVPCNSQIAKLLQSLPKGDLLDPVFTSRNGGIISNKLLLKAYWKPKLTKLIKKGLVDRYRPLYNTRHTAITRMLESGLTSAEVARVVGNSPKVITEHYAGVSRLTVLPEI